MPGESARINGRKGGRPKGKAQSTLTKEMGRELLRNMVLAHLQPMVEAQVANAQGIKYLVARDKRSGKFTRVTAAMAGALKGDEVIEVWEKDPAVQAFTDLLNRALDKPAEHVEVTGKDDGPIAFKWQG